MWKPCANRRRNALSALLLTVVEASHRAESTSSSPGTSATWFNSCTHPVETAVRLSVAALADVELRSDTPIALAWRCGKYFHEWTSANVCEQLLNLLLVLRVTICT
jgi:hypothetical protein